jgi:hypothetical protein
VSPPHEIIGNKAKRIESGNTFMPGWHLPCGVKGGHDPSRGWAMNEAYDHERWHPTH